MNALRLVVPFVLVLGLAACGSSQIKVSQVKVMPDVKGQKLDVALGDMKRAGFEDKVDIIGGGIFGVVVKSNWEVCNQSPAAGQALTAAPQLTVARSCGDEAPAPTASPTVTSSSGGDEILTVRNNKDFAAILAMGDECASSIGKFAAKYQDRTIEFNGVVTHLAHAGSYKTRYDILISPGNSAANAGVGPVFKFENVNTTYDLHWTGSNTPGTVGVGTKLRITARVDHYNGTQCLFFLDPVSTVGR
jgi:hypothetical protein